MLEITVALHLWILSQVAVFFSICFAVWSYLVKDRSKTLFINTIACLFLFASCLFLSNWVFATIMSISIARNVVFWALEKWPTKYDKQIKWVSVFLFIAATVLTVVFLHEWWFDWVMLGVNIYIIVAMSINGIHWLRSAFIVADSATIVNHLVFFNIIGIVQCCIQILANIIFYILFFIRKRKNKRVDQVDTAVANE